MIGCECFSQCSKKQKQKKFICAFKIKQTSSKENWPHSLTLDVLFLWQQNADFSPARSALKSFKKETKCEFTDGCGILLLSVSNTKRAAFRIVNVAGVSCSWSWLGGPRSPITYKCKHEWSREEDENPVKTFSQSQVGVWEFSFLVGCLFHRWGKLHQQVHHVSHAWNTGNLCFAFFCCCFYCRTQRKVFSHNT